MAHSINETCTECGACAAACPVNAIKSGTPYVIDADTCTDCGACTNECPVDAISEG